MARSQFREYLIKLLIVSLLSLPMASQSQVVLYRVLDPALNPGNFPLFGAECIGVEDLNTDGVPDFAVSDESSAPGGVVSGTVYFFSGRDGQLLRSIDGPPISGIAYESGFGRHMTQIWDDDGDGVGDLAVTAHPDNLYPYLGMVFYLSGRTGQIISQFSSSDPQEYLGFSLSAPLRCLGQEVLPVSAPWGINLAGVQSGNIAYLPRGAIQPTAALFGRTLDEFFGVALTSLGDTNGNGCDELAVAAYDAAALKLGQAGRIDVFDSLSGQRLYAIDGWASNFHLGQNIEAVGDINQDGALDFGVAAEGGYWAIRSGRDGSSIMDSSTSAIRRRTRPKFDSAGGDLDGDGVDDFLISRTQFGSNPSLDGVAFVSGRTGEPLGIVRGNDRSDHLGACVHLIGDTNGDLATDFVIGQPTNISFSATPQQVLVVSLQCGIAPIGVGSAEGNSYQPQLFATTRNCLTQGSDIDLELRFDIEANRGSRGYIGALLVGSLDTTGTSFPSGGKLYVRNAQTIPFSVLTANQFSWSTRIPQSARQGSQLAVQALFVDDQGRLGSSNALVLTVM